MSDTAKLESLGLDPSAPDAQDTLKLVEYLLERGATEDEVREAASMGALGPLGLELALRPAGEPVSFPAAAAGADLDLDDAVALWRALGHPDPLESGATLTPAQVQTLQVLGAMGKSLLGMETTLQLARVIGGAVAQVAEAIVDAFRVRVEVPRLSGGEAYSDVVADYANTASAVFPVLADAITDTLRTYVLRASRSSWAPDDEQAAVTRERAVGFVDLVGYTGSARALSPAALTDVISRFESRVADVVGRLDARVVKLIGDEAMFVADDPAQGAKLALELLATLRADEQLPPVRIGLAAGPVVAHSGDYFGDVVNLAARLVKVADPGTALVSEPVADAAPDGVAVGPIEVPPLKGYEESVAAYRLTAPKS